MLEKAADFRKKLPLAVKIAGVLFVTAVFLYLVPARLELLGPQETETALHREYKDPGASFRYLFFDLRGRIVTVNEVDTDVPGTYTVRYDASFLGRRQTLERRVTVKDMTPPVLRVKAPELIVAELAVPYVFEPEVSAYDETDGDVSDTVWTEYPEDDTYGWRLILLKARDSAGNVGVYPQPVLFTDGKDPEDPSLAEGVLRMEVEEGCWKITARFDTEDPAPVTAVLLSGKPVGKVTTLLSEQAPGYREVSFPLQQIPEGDYRLKFFQGNEGFEVDAGNILPDHRLGRRLYNGRLYTWDYEDGICLSVRKADYEYDIAIDVGHGNEDGGAVSYNGLDESVMNLAVALYEKQRYESMGLKVWLIREEQEYEELMGTEEWKRTSRVGWTVGWHGAVSRYTYSLHHNSGGSGRHRGPEIIVNPTGTEEDIPYAYRLHEEFETIYPVIDTTFRMFTRDYMYGGLYDRSLGEEYPDMRIYYANHRIPLENFGVTVVTYEGCYINNRADFDWYWKKENWKLVSEARIRAYCEALGVPYIAPEGS